MGFIDDIKESMGISGVFAPVFRAVIIGDDGVYIEGVKSVKSYSPDRVEISLKRGIVVIKGENLYIKKYCAGDLAVCGKIKALERI